MAKRFGLAEIRSLFEGRDETLGALDNGFRVYRKRDDGNALMVNIRFVEEHGVLLFSTGLASPEISEARHAEVAKLLATINFGIAQGGFVMREFVNFRTHAYLDADGGIDDRVILESVDFVVDAGQRYGGRIIEAIGAAEFEIEA